MINERPATIIACPRCYAALTLPVATPSAADLACPICKAEFACSAAGRPELPVARIVARVASPTPSYLDLPLPDLAASGVHIFEPSLSNANHSAPTIPQPPAHGTSVEHPATPAPSPQSLDHFDDVDVELDVDETPTVSVGGNSSDVDPHAATAAISPGRTVRLNEQLAAAVHEAAPSSSGDAAHAVDPMNFAAEPHDYDDEADDGPVATAFAPEFALKAAPRRRRRKNGVTGLVGIVGGGVIGLLLGGYALLWIRGEAGDIFQMSRWLPPALLPPSMQATASDAGERPSVSQSAAVASEESDAVDESESSEEFVAAAAPSEVRVDAAVTPATAVEPLPADASTEVAAPAPPLVVKWPVTPLIADLRDRKFHSLGDLAATVALGEEASKTFVDGDLSKSSSVRALGGAYVQLCALAEQFTLANPADYGANQFTQLALAKAALRRVTMVERRNDLAVIATRWVQHDRRQNQGVILVGTVRDLWALGPWTECRVEIAVGGKALDVPVVMDRLEFNVGREVGVVGVIVADPQQRVVGYEGDAQQIIVAGDAFDPSTVVVEEFSAEFMLPGE